MPLGSLSGSTRMRTISPTLLPAPQPLSRMLPTYNSPRGELYVGSIRDSGWGAGNNVGEIVRIRVDPDKLPSGIAEVRAVADGFTIDFFRPVDHGRAAFVQNYRSEERR